jgi:hypothetical protein
MRPMCIADNPTSAATDLFIADNPTSAATDLCIADNPTSAATEMCIAGTPTPGGAGSADHPVLAEMSGWSSVPALRDHVPPQPPGRTA